MARLLPDRVAPSTVAPVVTAHPDIAGLSDWRPLARGGFAAVWQARQDSLGRQVAVKVDFRPLDDDKQRRRFLREAGAAGRLSGHPGIVTVHDAGILPDDRPYLVLELCPGGSLSAWLSPEKRPPIQRVRDVGVRIADALAAAHARGVIHRDVKPANILIDAYGHAGLTDFGLAAMPEPGSRAVGHDGGADAGVRAAGDVPLAPGHGVRATSTRWRPPCTPCWPATRRAGRPTGTRRPCRS